MAGRIMDQHQDTQFSTSSENRDAVAVIGMSCLFPGSPDVDTYWRNILNKVDSITEPPEKAWDPAVYYDPEFADADKVYCQRGGYLGNLVSFDPLAHGVPPLSVGGEPDQWLALKLAYAAMADAGCTDLPEEVRHRTAVVLGKGTYLNGGNATAIQRSLFVGQTLEILKQVHPEFSDSDIEKLREEMKRVLPPMGSEMVAGLIPNIIVGRIANRLDLMGPTYTVDAACASSLVALQLAVRDLLSGECDLALAGGSQVWMPVPALNVFCRLGALSPRQQIKPFDKDADGTLLGEGIGMVVLKRLSDAERDGDRIYSVIKGIGVASDGRGVSVMAPRVDGEILALRRAYAEAGVSPSSVGLIEAHGTATAVGDVVEVQALTAVFGRRNGELPGCALGSVKSMISHTIPAAGIAGLIKTSLALYHKVLPPTLNVDEPNPKLELETSPFYLNTETRPWIHAGPEPRRAGINAFGFGGINAHAVLEEYRGLDPRNGSALLDIMSEKPSETLAHLPNWESEVFILESESQAGLQAKSIELAARLDMIPQSVDLQRNASRTFNLADVAMTVNSEMGQVEQPLRLAIVATSILDLQEKLQRSAERLADPECRQIKEVGGIYYSADPLGRAGKLAFLFPGEGAQYQNMLADLCLHFPEVRETFDRVDRIFLNDDRDYQPSDYVFPRPAFSEEERRVAQERLMQMDSAIEAVLTANLAVFGLVSRLGLQPDALVGHSTGEYSAALAAGVLDLDTEERLSSFSRALNTYYRDAVAQDNVPRAVLLAIGTDRETAQAIADEADGNIFVAIDNCPHQVVLIGDIQSAARAREIVEREALIYEQLTYDRAVHTPLFAPFTDPLQEIFEHVAVRPARTPLYSCTTAAPYPEDPSAIRKLFVEHWTAPVEFRRTVEQLYDEGFRMFVEVGPRGNLTAFVQDILRGRDFAAVPANVQRRTGVTQLNHLVGLIASQGVNLDVSYLYSRRMLRVIDWEELEHAAQTSTRNTRIQLATGWPALRLSQEVVDEIRRPYATPPRPAGSDRPQHAKKSDAQPGDYQQPTGHREPETTVDSESGWGYGDYPGPVPDASPSFHPSAEPATSLAPAWAQITSGGSDEVSDIVDAYFDTMGQFLVAQEDVMVAYLVGVHAQPTDARIAPESRWDIVPIAALPVALPNSDDSGPAFSWPAEDAEPVLTNGSSPSGVDNVGEPNGLGAQTDQDFGDDHSTGLPDTFQAEQRGGEEIGQRVTRQLLEPVSDRTGYPIEMLDQHYGGVDDADLERLVAQRTLQEIIDIQAPDANGSYGVQESTSSVNEPLTGDQPTPPAPDETTFPLLGTIVSAVPGKELTARRTFDLDADPYLKDHTLGRDVSVTDPHLTALAVMPLTMSLEILAEAAACLLPGKTVIGLRDVRAHRWMAWDQQVQELQVTARVSGDSGDPALVHVQLRNLTEDDSSETPSKSPIIEATVVLKADYPAAPEPLGFELFESRASQWTPAALYEDGGMFHGPKWQGVASIERTGANGSIAQLRVLPFDSFLLGTATPEFVIDPVVLDAAGQVIGFWTAEHLSTANVIFPFRLATLDVYASQRPAGDPITCSAVTRLVGDQLVDSDIDLVTADGKLWMRLTGWSDKRFELPPHFGSALVTSNREQISAEWPDAVAGLVDSQHFQCRMVSTEFPSDQSFWSLVWAQKVLSRAERLKFSELRMPESRQLEWLGARTAAKEALNQILQARYGLDLLSADIEIGTDEMGRPVVGGAWLGSISATPLVSLAHTRGTAVALATLVEPADAGGTDRLSGIGIDIEYLRARPEGFADVAFSSSELALLERLPADLLEEWTLRCWCAKEAVAKATGAGLIDGPQSVSVLEIDVNRERITTRLAGKLAQDHSELANIDLVAHTTRRRDLIVAVTVAGSVDI